MPHTITTKLIAAAVLLFSSALLASTFFSKEKADSQVTRQLTVMAINDIYNIEGVDAQSAGGMARIRALRKRLSSADNPVMLLHAGDFLFPSSMSSQYQGEQMIDVMNLLDGDAKAFDGRLYVTFGNHEFDKGKQKHASLLSKRIAQSDFYWLASNIKLDESATLSTEDFKQSLLSNHLTTINGIKVGLFSLTIDMAEPEYAKINADYLSVAKDNISQLKEQGAEVIIALTHLRISQDEDLLKALGEAGPDVIFGGHEHNRQHVCVAKRCVIKADADGRSATVATISLTASGELTLSHKFELLNSETIESDPIVEQRSQYWLDRYQQDYCQKYSDEAGCLKKVLGKTSVELVAEELEIRRFETNLGSYVAEQMMHAFENIELPAKRKVQAALINAGSLRLNQNIPAETALTPWYLNALFQYPVSLHLIDISGAQLKSALMHSVENWTGSGWWLQSAGIAFRHDAEHESIAQLSLIDEAGKLSPVTDEQRILVVVSNYIVDPSIGDQDGYTMLNLDNEVIYGTPFDLKKVVADNIQLNWSNNQAISPALPGRVCSSARAENHCVLDGQ
jgi:2',3'-cyclic-nucleotide 2'-phosphodiesterase (5'-nucleotidase family)